MTGSNHSRPARHTIAAQLGLSLMLFLSLGAIFSSAQAQLVANWKMDESGWTGSAGEVLNSNGSNHRGTARGQMTVPTTAPGKVCNAGHFRGQGFSIPEAPWWIDAQHYVDVPSSNQLSPLAFNNREMTIGGWFRMDQSGGTIIHKGEGGASQEYQVHVTDSRLRITLWDRWGSANSMELSSQSLAINTWYFFSVSVERLGNSANVRVTGYLYGEGGQIGGPTQQNLSVDYTDKNTSGRVFFGAISFGSAPVGFFSGLIDEVRLYDTVRSPAEIAAHWASSGQCPVIAGPNHIRLIHSANGLTCSPSTVTIHACANANCTELFTEPVTVALTSPAGNWLPNPASVTQSANVSLQVTSPGLATLNAQATSPQAANPTRCFNGGLETNCQMTWHNAGFVINLPSHISAASQPGTIAAVRSDDVSQACVPGFANETRTVSMRFGRLNPASGTQMAGINGNSIGTASPGTPLALNFDAGGVAALSIQYPDVGAIAVHALYEGSGPDAGLVMTGQTELVVRPSHFTLDPAVDEPATDATGPVFRRAGEAFQMTVAARNAAGNITPNFGRESTPAALMLDTDLLEPAGGASPAIDGSFGAFGLDCEGSAAQSGVACGVFTWPEVGIIELTPRLASGNYLGSLNVVGVASGPIGRFIPDHFTLSGGSIQDRAALNGCTDSFSYIGERFDAEFTLTARNTSGVRTSNYHAAFARLDDVNQLGMDASGDFEVSETAIEWVLGSGVAVVEAHMPRSTPDGPFGPFENYLVGTHPNDADGVGMNVFNLDLSRDGTDDHALVGETALRFGRLVVDNSIGSEHGPVALPLRAETWNGATWIVSASDNCTLVNLVNHVLLTGEDGSSVVGNEIVDIGANGSTQIDSSSILMLDAGRGHFLFTTPGDPGWVNLGLILDNDYPYLRDDLAANDDFVDNPEARATFGLFSGDRRRILLQETAPN